METSATTTDKELFIKMAVANWELQNSRLNGLLARLTDEEFSAPTAPGRNTGTYILGHLTAVSDGLFTFLQLGDRLYPELENLYLRNPESADLERPSLPTLKDYWAKVNAVLDERLTQMQPDEWFTAHSAISAEDFAKEPFRNKLNILMNRTGHLAYHVGQLIYLVKPKV